MKHLFDIDTIKSDLEKGGIPTRKKQAVHLVLHYPSAESDRQELACRIAQIHAESVIAGIKSLDCPDSQKLRLLEAVMEEVKGKAENLR